MSIHRFHVTRMNIKLHLTRWFVLGNGKTDSWFKFLDKCPKRKQQLVLASVSHDIISIVLLPVIWEHFCSYNSMYYLIELSRMMEIHHYNGTMLHLEYLKHSVLRLAVPPNTLFDTHFYPFLCCAVIHFLLERLWTQLSFVFAMCQNIIFLFDVTLSIYLVVCIPC